MTRINSSIPVRCLTDEHLLAEHREIKRLPYCLRRAIQSGSINRIPERFTLGKGHVLFFLNKMEFLRQRYRAIYVECQLRHFVVTNYEDNFVYDIPDEYCNDYTPTDEENDLLTHRITHRIMESSKPNFHYNGMAIDKQWAVELLQHL